MWFIGGDPMKKRHEQISDEQWAKIEPLIPKPTVGTKGGRPRADDRLVFEGILWIARTGARWKDLPERYPSPSTCWRRLQQWQEQEVFKDMWRAFLSELDQQELLDWDEAFMDGSFAPAKKGALESEKPRGVRDRSGWWWSMHRVYRWEAWSTLPRRLRLGSLKQP
jgi:transposase